jgi:hypothetical protein
MRQGEVPQAKGNGELRILMLGDSYTFGYGVDDTETFAVLLERDLNAFPREGEPREGEPRERAAHILVLNAGVPSYGTAHELLQFETTGRDLQADVVVLNVFLGNDIQDNLCLGYVSLEPHRRPPCFRVEDGALRELDLEEDLAPEREAPRPLWQRVVRTIRNAKVVEFTIQQGGRALTSNAWLARVLYAVGIEVHPGYDPHIVSGWYSPDYAERGWELTRALLLRLRDDVIASGARFAIVLIPSRIQVLPGLLELSGVLYAESHDVQRFIEDPGLPQRRMTAFAESLGIPILDLQPVFAENARVESLYFPIISHWNADGHRVAADAIAEFLSREGLAASPGARVGTSAGNSPRE